MTDKKICIGIDLGTTFSCCATWMDGEIRIIPNDIGNRTTPSYVAFTENNNETNIIVGSTAKNQVNENPKNTIYDAKRLIGREFDDVTIQNDIKHYSFNVINKDNKPYIKVDNKEYPPEFISAQILRYIKQCAERYLECDVKDAVITVPAYFNDQQRISTKNAGMIAGLNVLKIINEPTAAAIAYGFGINNEDKPKNILIFDYGGGTLDVSILNIEKNKFTVKSTNGDTHLGGEDIDNLLLDYFVNEIKNKHKIDISKDQKSLRKLKNECEKTKILLSSMLIAPIYVERIINGKDFEMQLTRAKLENICYNLFERIKEPIKKAIDDAHITKKDIDELILIGGSSKIPKVRDILIKYFEGIELNMKINPDEAVAYGAAVQGAKLLNIEEEKIEDLKIKDVTPLSLGVETLENDEMVMTTIIPRNSLIPAKGEDYFSTWKDNQEKVKIQVYEGERRCTKDNHLLGTFELKGISKKPKGIPKIKIMFEVDLNGILTATAIDEESGKDKKLIVEKSTSLSSEQIKNMLEETEKFKEIDKKNKEIDDAYFKFINLFETAKNTIINPNVITKIPVDYFEKIRNITENENYIKMQNNKNSYTIENFNKASSEISEILDSFLLIMKGILKNEPVKTKIEEVD